MARSLRVEYAGARYHVMCRGNQSRQIFKTDEDADLFVRTLGEVCVRNQVVVHAWCLMGNLFDNPDEEWLSDKRTILKLTG